MNSNRALWGIVLLAFALRVAASWQWFDRLEDDVDNYRSIAQMLVDGRGYSNQFTGEPTAFRPPLLPLVLAGLLSVGAGNAAIAAMQILLGTGTALLTGLISNRVLPSWKWLPPFMVAIDPLSLAYTPQVMTEVLSGFTLSLLLVAVVRESNQRALWLSGLTFGLAALCRPTVWAFLPLVALVGAGSLLRRQLSFGATAIRAATFLAGAAIIVGPWMARNMMVLNAPVFATTHGGYTLLLSNNPQFYNKVARVSWRTVWDSETWQDSLQRDLKTAGVTGERAVDRWMYNRATLNIKTDPMGCVLSSVAKFRRLWSPVPLAEAPGKIVKWSVGGFYVLVFAGMIGSVFCRLDSNDRLAFAASWIMILAFTSVHLFYWANTRMRAPLIAPMALLSALGWQRFANRRAEHTAKQAEDSGKV